MRAFAVAAVAILLSFAQASAEERPVCSNLAAPSGFRVPCSATWHFNGTCNGTDLWDQWKVTGQTSPDEPNIRPWLDREILVIGYELMRLQPPWRMSAEDKELNAALSWFMVGNLITPDEQIKLGPGQTQRGRMWPPGFAQPWPRRSDNPDKRGGFVNLHGTCWGGGPITIWLTLFWSPTEGQ